ncbi:YciI family protein [Pseudohoeflea coraliihabitans]|uniref:YCII-related domain-containing protein n=1 Tax=Pseudohoeflea coraliihabitans TaxID=2860393 RepID=A0ABS6WPR3_9HYPH|nr:YciI family protein [Pseudohoeflea sp. DP4N28-3]MBW3097952.1 hypothetical protein [Pseudohoeflea sp. DP4N28-3]
MPDYVFAYHGGGRPETQEEGEQAMQAWGKWYEEMGNAVVHGGGPVGASKTVSSGGVTDDGGANPLSGFTVVRADSIDAACAMAKGCPLVADGSGSVEVAPIIEM